MAEMDIKSLMQRFEAAWADKDKWRGVLEEVYAYALPYRNVWDTQAKGAERMGWVFDSTALTATLRFAGRLQNELTPPGQRWFELKAGPTITDEQQREGLNRVLEPIADVVHAVFNQDTFNTAMHEFYLDIAPGTAVMAVEEGDDRDLVRFRTLPQAQVAMGEGPHGKIDGYYYKRPEMQVALIETVWPDATVPEPLQQRVRQQQPGAAPAMVSLCEAVTRDYDADVWRYDVFWKEGGDKEAARLVSRSYRSQPWIGGRWFKLPGEVQGRGPLLLALPDIRTLNSVVEMVLENAALAIAGVYLVQAGDGEINPDNIEMAPAAFIPVERTGGPRGPSIVPLEGTHRFDVAQLVLEELRMSVKKVLLDDQLPPESGSVRSPTEIIARQRELFQFTAGAVGRLINEFIRPLVERVIEILGRKRVIEAPVAIDQLLIQLQVISPLARVQALENVEKVVQWLSLANELGGREMMMLGAKIEDIIGYLGEQLGVPMKLVREKQERDALQTMVAELVARNQMSPTDLVRPAANDAAVPRAGMDAAAGRLAA